MEKLFDNPFILAPMAGITDMPFRRLMKKLGAGSVITEFVSSHAVIHHSPRNERYLAYHEEERPVGVQLFGGEADVLVKAAQMVEARGFDFVDINLGCPVPKVVRKKGGSAWLNHPVELGKMLVQLKKALDVPLTIKIRTGWDSDNINAAEIVKIAEDSGVTWVGVHGRTRAQGYSGQADWNLIESVAKNSEMPIIGNGDIISGPMATARLVSSGCAGVMIARGALKNPWIFQESVEAYKKYKAADEASQKDMISQILSVQCATQGDVPDGKDYYQKKIKKLQPKPVQTIADWVKIRADRDALALMNQHIEYLREIYPEQRVRLNFRKFLAWYAAGYPGAHNFRKFIFNTEDFQEILDKAHEFFEDVKKLGGSGDTVREAAPVLMSGHG